MARRSKKKSITIKDPESLAILGVICMVASALLFISLFSSSEVLDIFRKYFGYGVAVMSIVLFAASLRLFGTKGKYNSYKVVIFLIIFMFTFLAWIHLFVDIDQAKEIANKGEYGGVIGYQLSLILRQKLSFEGAFVSLGILTFLSFLVALDVSPKQVGEGIVKFLNVIVSIGKSIRDFSVKMYRLALKGKAKMDNFEMNILNTKSQNKSENPSSGDEQKSGGIPLFNPFDVKMVSDISGKKDVDLGVSGLKINNKEVPLAVAEKVTTGATTSISKPVMKERSAESEDAQAIDLSVRKYPDWQLPPVTLLDELNPKTQDSKEVIERKAAAILETLKSFNIQAKILGHSIGPTVTQYFIDPAAGIKFSKIANLSKDLALTLASPSDLRIELVPGKSYIGIDVPNDIRQFTQFKESLTPVYQDPKKYTLGMAVGIDTQGTPIIRDLAEAPHLLVAGATGMGKSVLVNAFIVSLLMQKTPDELKFIMIDPKMVEMAGYDGIPHLLTSPITDMSKASNALKWVVNEMEERYKIFKDARVRNLEQYLRETGNLMPYIVVIIDEFSDLMMQFRQDVEASIIRLAQKSRATGIHLILATQRPTADVITGLIKSNVPSRVALTVASSMDSRVVLDSTGAETLLGKGDLLFKTAKDLRPVRIQGLNIPDAELNRILEFIRAQAPDVVYEEDQILTVASEGGEMEGDFSSADPLFKQAAQIVIGAQKGSASLLQTKMKIGYARAARLVDELEMAGIVGPQDGPRPRDVLVSDFDAFFNSQLQEE